MLSFPAFHLVPSRFQPRAPQASSSLEPAKLRSIVKHNSVLVTTSKALVTRSDALVTSSVLSNFQKKNGVKTV